MQHLRLLRRPDRRPALSSSPRTSKSAATSPARPTSMRRRWRWRPASPRPGSRSARCGRGSATTRRRPMRSGRARAADPEDRHGAAVQLARLTGEATPMPAGLCARAVRPVRQALRPVAAGGARLSRAAASVRRGDGGVRRARPRDAVRPRARSRLRHRARRRGVRAAHRFAGRRRSLAGDDRAGARAPAATIICMSATCSNSLRARTSAAPIS